MKNKLLFILPMLLTLSSCGEVQHTPAKWCEIECTTNYYEEEIQGISSQEIYSSYKRVGVFPVYYLYEKQYDVKVYLDDRVDSYIGGIEYTDEGILSSEEHIPAKNVYSMDMDLYNVTYYGVDYEKV